MVGDSWLSTVVTKFGGGEGPRVGNLNNDWEPVRFASFPEKGERELQKTDRLPLTLGKIRVTTSPGPRSYWRATRDVLLGKERAGSYSFTALPGVDL